MNKQNLIIYKFKSLYEIFKELEINLNPGIKQYNQSNKIYPKGRSKMGMPGTKVRKFNKY